LASASSIKRVTKVAVLAPYTIYPALTGGQKAITSFYKQLSYHLPIVIISTTKNVKEDAVNISLAALLGSSSFRYINLLLFFKLKKFLKQQQITHLIIDHPYFGWLGILLQRSTGIKLIVRSHNIEGLRWKTIGKWWWKILWRYEKFTHANADFNFFITDDDKHYAIKHFKLKPEKCSTITYGISESASNITKEQAKQTVYRKHNIAKDRVLILFNGVLDYKPNLDAVEAIITHINPILLSSGLTYQMVICGKNPPLHLLHNAPNIIFTGFVDDINLYYNAADIFINPVVEGGGIKTKLVEALSFQLNVVSTVSGAKGIPVEVCGEKLVVVQDYNWKQFANAIVSVNTNASLPSTFYTHFLWKNIAQKAANIITSL